MNTTELPLSTRLKDLRLKHAIGSLEMACRLNLAYNLGLTRDNILDIEYERMPVSKDFEAKWRGCCY